MKTELVNQLAYIGIPESQAQKVQDHLNGAKSFVYPSDPGIEGALPWLQNRLMSLPKPLGQKLIDITNQNRPDPDIMYSEEGYDSCQSHRKVAKIAAEAILLGGLVYEAGLLGKTLKLNQAQEMTNSSLQITECDLPDLMALAKYHGSKQDFLFPGVTPSLPTTASLEEMAFATLKGAPITSVRTLTGLGGIRHDKDWNHVTDLPTFVDLKVAEDKRYYPGIGIYYLLMKDDLSSFPNLEKYEKTTPGLIAKLEKLKQTQSRTPKYDFSGVSVLCATHIPTWGELKHMQFSNGTAHLELDQSFHSPSYEFMVLRAVLEDAFAGKKVSEIKLAQIDPLVQKTTHCWSFNSTIHLPWTAENADLSNGLIGRVGNRYGDYGIRYGVGFKNKSLEIRKYVFGNDRQYPFGVAGTSGYETRTYAQNSEFTGTYQTEIITPQHHWWKSTENNGFMKTALQYLDKL
jgi:hypothetical protein